MIEVGIRSPPGMLLICIHHALYPMYDAHCFVAVYFAAVLLTHWPLGDFNSILCRSFSSDFFVNGGWGISYEIALDLTDDKSTLVQAMAWCRQATSHYLNQCWPKSMPPNGVTRPQWVKVIFKCMWYMCSHSSGLLHFTIKFQHAGRDLARLLDTCKMAAKLQTITLISFSSTKIGNFDHLLIEVCSSGCDW